MLKTLRRTNISFRDVALKIEVTASQLKKLLLNSPLYFKQFITQLPEWPSLYLFDGVKGREVVISFITCIHASYDVAFFSLSTCNEMLMNEKFLNFCYNKCSTWMFFISHLVVITYSCHHQKERDCWISGFDDDKSWVMII